MEQQQFDRLVRQQLEAFETQFQPGAWERMEEALTADEAQHGDNNATTRFDEAVKRHLLSLEGMQPQAHWGLLLRRLERIQIFQSHLFGFKLAEVVLVVWLVLTNVSNPPLWFESPLLARLRDANRTTVVQQNRSTALDRNATSKSAQLLSAESDSAGPAALTSASEQPSGAEPVGPTSAMPRSFSISQIPLLRSPEPHYLTSTATTKPLLPSRQAEGSFPLAAAEQSTGGMQASAATPLRQLEGLPVLSRRRAALATASSRQAEWEQEVRPVKERRGLNVAMFGGPDYNRIVAPPNPELGNTAEDFYALGYSGGINFALDYGTWEFGTGLHYSAKQYDPRQVGFITGSLRAGYNGEVLREIQLNIFGLPLQARYNLVRNHRWRWYLIGGSTLYVATDATYFIGPLELPYGGGTPLPQPSETQFRNVNQGFLQGGSFRENSYVTANIGLGAERFVSERVSLFFQPTYQHAFGYFSEGFGPNKNRLHTLSLQTGIRVRVKY